jgi:hypothetical protein
MLAGRCTFGPMGNLAQKLLVKCFVAREKIILSISLLDFFFISCLSFFLFLSFFLSLFFLETICDELARSKTEDKAG